MFSEKLSKKSWRNLTWPRHLVCESVTVSFSSVTVAQNRAETFPFRAQGELDVTISSATHLWIPEDILQHTTNQICKIVIDLVVDIWMSFIQFFQLLCIFLNFITKS